MSNWNGKVKCIESYSSLFTESEIYIVINGMVYDNKNLELTCNSYMDVNDLNDNFCSQFEEIKNENVAILPKNDSDLPNKFPVLCGLLGVEVGEKFKVKDIGVDYIIEEIYRIDERGFIYNSYYKYCPNIAINLINKHYEIVKIPQYQFTENEITILAALFLNDYYYIARDEDNTLSAFQEKPEECEGGEYLADTGNYCKIKDEFFPQVQWGNILDIKFELDKLN